MMYRRLRQAMIVALFMGAWPLVAQAGDAAKLDILGFSKDGGVFAFEEYGVQDGSGFPYANRFQKPRFGSGWTMKRPHWKVLAARQGWMRRVSPL
jgi:hypothetical protein